MIDSKAPVFQYFVERWPLIMAALFSAFTLVLLLILSTSEAKLRHVVDARLVADSARRAAAIADFVKERRQAAAELASLHEIDHYLINRALGMSPRYGLNASLNFVEQRFLKFLQEKTLRDEPVYRRILFLDVDGRPLVDVGERGPVPAVGAHGDAAIDVTRSRIVAVAPVVLKGESSGRLVTVTDLSVLRRLLLDAARTPAGDTVYRELLIFDGGDLIAAGGAPDLAPAVGPALASLPDNRLVEAVEVAGAERLGDTLLLRTAIVGTPLSIVTLTSQAEAYGKLASPAYTLYLGVFSAVLMLAAMALDRMRLRLLRLQEDYSASDRHRAELAQRNTALSGEIARRRAVESALNEKTERLDRANAELRIAAAAFDAQEGMVVADADRVVLRVNRAFVRMSGYAAEEVVGRPIRLPKPDGHDGTPMGDIWDAVTRTGGWQGEIHDRTRTGEHYSRWLTISAVKDADGTATHFIGTYYDISERKRAEQRIKELAFFDQLTGLPNRALLRDRIEQLVIANSRNGAFGALLFIDLDNFKTLNDTLGHDVGDLLLKEVARRLTECVRASDTVARLGGDEFVVLLAGLGPREQEAAIHAKTLGEKLLTALNGSYRLGRYEYLNTPSIGVALVPDRRESVDELLKRADLAMYEAKAAGRNTLRFFDPAMQTVVNERAALEADIRTALTNDQFVLHYQPQVGRDGRVTGAEALLRWVHPTRGMVPPGVFVPIAEATGLIRPLGRWVMETACRQLAAWSRRPETAHLSIAVNVSALQLHHKDFVDHVLTAIERTGADPRRLELELTESLLVHNIEEVIAKMTALKQKGIRFSLDDFGTGYSSLAYLKRLPLDQLKIDQGFVRDILDDANDAAIAKTIILLGATLGLDVIAEGVETDAQRRLLERQGCHFYQGYLFGRPLPAAEFEAWLSTPLRRPAPARSLAATG